MVKMEYCALDRSIFASYLFKSDKNGFCRAGNGLRSFSVGRIGEEEREGEGEEEVGHGCLFCVGCIVFVIKGDWLFVITPLVIAWELLLLLLPLLLLLLLLLFVVRLLLCEAGVEVIDDGEEDDEDGVCDDVEVEVGTAYFVNDVLTASLPTNRKEEVELHRNKDKGITFLEVLDEDKISESNTLAPENCAHLRSIIAALWGFFNIQNVCNLLFLSDLYIKLSIYVL